MEHTVNDEADALELRVLHGPQAGSTLPLEAGVQYTLGAADTCAVLLAGPQLEPEHAALVAEGGGIQVTPLGGRVTTLDRSEVAAGDALPLGTVLRLGRVMLTVDSVSAPWPHDEVLEDPEPPPPAREAEQAAPPVEAEAAPAPRASPQVRAKGVGLMPSLLLGSAAMLLMGAAVAAWVNSDGQASSDGDAAPVIAVPAAPPAQAVEEPDVAALSRAIPGAALSAERAGDGRWVVRGRVPSEAAREKLRDMLARLPAEPQSRVLLDAERMAAALDFVEKQRVQGKVELKLKDGGNGALRITGAAATQADLAAVMDAARTELEDVMPVEFSVPLRAELATKFQDRLRAAGLAPKFRVISRDPRLELQAVLSPQEVRAWEAMFIEFTREYGSVLTVTAQVHHEKDLLEVQIETVVAGAFPYVVTTGGRRVAPGGVLDGRTLFAIRDGELVFSDGLRVRYGN